MNALSLNESTHAAKATVDGKKRWKVALRRMMVVLFAAPLVIVPAAVLAVVAVVTGPPILVTVNGTVGTGADAVALSGQIKIATRIIPDPDFNSPTNLELTIDFSNVTGKGNGSGTSKFSTEAQTIIHRPLLALDPIEVTFPYSQANSANSAKTAKATLMVSFNAASGVSITSTVVDMPLK